MSDATVNQPMPKGQVDVFPELIKDIEARRDKGIETYGEPLRTNNGRDPLIDLYQELLDAAVYIKQELMERQSAVAEERCAGIFHRRYTSVTWWSEEGVWMAAHPDLSGCMAHGDTKDDALLMLDEMRFDYLMHLIEEVDERHWPDVVRQEPEA